jgi:hypothetical protein
VVGAALLPVFHQPRLGHQGIQSQRFRDLPEYQKDQFIRDLKESALELVRARVIREEPD